MEFNNEDSISDIERVLSGGRQIKGNKYAVILNRNKIKIKNVKLKKRETQTED